MEKLKYSKTNFLKISRYTKLYTNMDKNIFGNFETFHKYG